MLGNAYLFGGGSQQGGGQLPINQRMKASYDTSGITIDMWKIISEGSVTVAADGVLFSAASNADGRFSQPLIALQPDTTYTASFLFNIQSGTTRLGVRTGGGDWNDGSNLSSGNFQTITFTTPADTNLETKEFGIFATGTVKIYAAKLEEGSGQTLAYQGSDGSWKLLPQPDMDFAMQLAKCQRYQVNYSFTSDDFTNATYLGVGFATTDSTARVLIDLPVPIRTTPAVTFSGIQLLSCKDLKHHTISGITTLWMVSQTKLVLQVTIDGTELTAGDMVFLEHYGISNLLLDSNL